MIWAISNDEPDNLREFRKRSRVSFPLLLDPSRKTLVDYGVLNEVIAHPAVAIIDRDGIVRYWRVDIDFRDRPPVDELLRTLDELAE